MFTKNQIAQFLFNKNYHELTPEELKEFQMKTVVVKIGKTLLGYNLIGYGGEVCPRNMRDT